MVESILDNQIPPPGESGDDAEVRHVPRGKEQGPLAARETSELIFQCVVDGGVTGYQVGRRGAGTPLGGRVTHRPGHCHLPPPLAPFRSAAGRHKPSNHHCQRDWFHSFRSASAGDALDIRNPG